MSRVLSTHSLADEELIKALAWYDEDAGGGEAGEQLARRFFAYHAKIEAEILERPKQWNTFHKDYRRRVFTGWPYSMIYYVADTDVRVVALAHGYKQPLYWRKRR